jgi:hypothetical protein
MKKKRCCELCGSCFVSLEALIEHLEYEKKEGQEQVFEAEAQLEELNQDTH